MEQTRFEPPADVGQPGWVRLADGARAYRYDADSELIREKQPES